MPTVDRRRPLAVSLREWLISYFRSIAWRIVLFALLWWILTEGEMDSWLIGVPVILFAALVSTMLLPPFSGSLIGILRFMPLFLWRSLSGGVDVARRAMHPRLPLLPTLFYHRWRLPVGQSRVFMVNIVSLLPGTLSVEFDANCLLVHVLDEQKDFLSEIEKLEQSVAAMFDVPLLSPNGEEC